MHTKKTSRGRLVPMRKHFDRRQNPRVELMSELYGCVVALDLPVRIRDASRGGFAVESACDFPVGSEHSFRFQTEDGRSTTVIMVCRHAKRVSASDQPPIYSAGFEFRPQAPETISGVLRVIAAAVDDRRPRVVLEREIAAPPASVTRSAAARQRRR